MTKLEFKKAVRHVRIVQAQFEERIQSLPCGADDAAYESYIKSYDAYMNKKGNEQLKRFFDMQYDCDQLKAREESKDYYKSWYPHILKQDLLNKGY